MNIPEAIKTLNQVLAWSSSNLDPTVGDATKLGIEALERVLKMRTYKPTPPGIPLPSETKE